MLNFKPLISKPSTRLAMSTWFFSLLLLAGCGGGSTGGTVVEETTSTTPAPSSPAPATPLISPGAYVASLNGKDWVAMLLPTTQGSGTITNFYGMHYSATDPDLFSGSGMITNNSSANLSRVFVYPNITAAARTGTGSLSYVGNGAVRASLSFPSTGSEQGKDINVVASQPSNYKFNTAPTLDSVQGTWQGRWSYGFGYVDNFSLSISAQGNVTTSMSFQQDCTLTQGMLAPNFDGTNLFTFSVTIPTATQCSLKSQTLNGAAFVTTSPVTGKSQRLYLIGVTTDGRGISYKADR
jgi:hypothetical protein